jgi:hypothetical protein
MTAEPSPILRLNVALFPPTQQPSSLLLRVKLRPVPLTGAWATCGSDVGGRNGLQQVQRHFGIRVAGGVDGIGVIGICKKRNPSTYSVRLISNVRVADEINK